MDAIKPIIESLLFVAGEPLTVDRIKKVLTEAETQDIRRALSELAEEYEARQGGFFLREVAGGYQIRTRPEYQDWIKRFIQPSPTRLSKPALETLAIVAYKQPIMRSDIEHIRGVDCGGTLRTLLERKLIRVLGRKQIPGRPLIYATTKQFLEVFDLKDLRDLPTPDEIDALTSTDLEESDEIDAPDSADSEESDEIDAPGSTASEESDEIDAPGSADSEESQKTDEP